MGDYDIKAIQSSQTPRTQEPTLEQLQPKTLKEMPQDEQKIQQELQQQFDEFRREQTTGKSDKESGSKLSLKSSPESKAIRESLMDLEKNLGADSKTARVLLAMFETAARVAFPILNAVSFALRVSHLAKMVSGESFKQLDIKDKILLIGKDVMRMTFDVLGMAPMLKAANLGEALAPAFLSGRIGAVPIPLMVSNSVPGAIGNIGNAAMDVGHGESLLTGKLMKQIEKWLEPPQGSRLIWENGEVVGTRY